MAGGSCRERRQKSRTTRWREVAVGSSGSGRAVRGGGCRHTRAMSENGVNNGCEERARRRRWPDKGVRTPGKFLRGVWLSRSAGCPGGAHAGMWACPIPS
eukprot:225152-Prymnesium_polylepis.1